MAWGLTAGVVAEYAAKPFVRQALAKPFHPASVLSFITGVDYKDPTAPEQLRSGEFTSNMNVFWFSGHEDYDKLCQHFSPVVRAVADKTLDYDEWQSSVDGKVAQLVLCDQLSRNCFRGSDECYEYDDMAQDLARELTQVALFPEKKEEMGLEGEMYGPYGSFVILALMHSELQEDHEACLKVIDHWGKTSSPQMGQHWKNYLKFELEHKEVVDKFGRYPHRNKKKGRESTPEELEWLASDDLPIWAKS